MKNYIFGARNGIHILDLQKSLPLFKSAMNFVTAAVARGESVLFVGTKKQAQEVIKVQAQRCGMFHVTHRWLGGTLTNFRTIRASIVRLKEVERMLTDGTTDALTKKETLKLFREREKLEANLGGIKNMEYLPGVVVIIDTNKEHIAVAEAKKLGIKTIALLDSNSDPRTSTCLFQAMMTRSAPSNSLRADSLTAIAGKRQHNERFSTRK